MVVSSVTGPRVSYNPIDQGVFGVPFATFTIGILGVLVITGEYTTGMILMGGHGVSLGAPDALRAVIGAALFLTVGGLLGMGLGFLTRSTAGGIAAVVGIDVVAQILSHSLSASWQPRILPYLPDNAGQAVFATSQYYGSTLHPWSGFAVYCGYTAAVIAAAAITVRRRDA